MPTKKGVLRGSKISSKHSTVIDTAQPIVRKLKSLPSVSKVALGAVTRVSPGQKHLKIDEVQSGLRVAVRGSTSRQILYVYTQRPSEARDVLLEVAVQLGFRE